MSSEVSIRFRPDERVIRVPRGSLLLEACTRAGYDLPTPCGGGGTCGKCRVKVQEGRTDHNDGHSGLSAAEWREGWRLACVTRVLEDLCLWIPPSDAIPPTPSILTEHAPASLALDCAIETRLLELTPPGRETNLADRERLEAALPQPVRIPHRVLQTLPTRLRDAGWRVQTVCHGATLLDVRPAEREAPLLGLAFDLGTTTVAGALLDLATGQTRAVASAINRQTRYGDDVLTRIQFARHRPDGLEPLQRAASETLNDLIGQLCPDGITRASVYRISLAGNSCMQQCLCGIDPRPLGEMPFVAALSRYPAITAAALGLELAPDTPVHLFPQPGSFVGGDTVAGMLACAFDRLSRPALLIDIGTNGEIALRHRDGIFCASTAAGPAFEGGRIRQGMRAEPGAIDRVLLQEDDLRINVIGNRPATGLCGSALIDAVAALRQVGIVDETGRIVASADLPATLPEPLRARILGEDADRRVRLTPPGDALADVCLTQQDIRELQLASGAIRAGIETLLVRAKLTVQDLEAVWVAGAFGNFIRRHQAVAIGLLPDLPEESIRFVGNAAFMGAKMALLSTVAMERADRLLDECRHIDLGTDPTFQMAFAEAMMFPDLESRV